VRDVVPRRAVEAVIARAAATQGAVSAPAVELLIDLPQQGEDHGANHRAQLNAILRVRQGDRYAAHGVLLIRGALLQEHLDDHMRDRVGVAPNPIDLLV
jgi:hypothetical protein